MYVKATEPDGAVQSSLIDASSMTVNTRLVGPSGNVTPACGVDAVAEVPYDEIP